MRGWLASLLLVALVGAGLAAYWYDNTHRMQEAVAANLAAAKKQFAAANEGVSIGWKAIERHAFPMGKGVRVVAPFIERKTANRTQTISVEYLDLYPRNNDLSRMSIEGPAVVKVKDVYQSATYDYSVKLSHFPSVMFRTPEEEKQLPEKARNFLGDTRITPAEQLAKLPPEIAHQVSVVLPSGFTMVISAAKKTVTKAFSLPQAPVRKWQPIDYSLADEISALTDILTNAVYYGK